MAPIHLGKFELTERSGKLITDRVLGDRVWIAAFVFSRCTSSCPRISAKMGEIQAKVAASKVQLASISVDPEFDKPEVLREFASRYRADADRWWYLTGPKEKVYDFILGGFKIIDVAESNPQSRSEGAEAVAHSDRLVLLDTGNRIVGTFDSKDDAAVSRLVSEAIRLDRLAAAERTGWVMRLPAVNASLNATCAGLLLLGWVLILKRFVRGHAACMISALAVSALFLSCYLVYHYHVGSIPFRGTGGVRIVYFSILLSHTVLAIAVVPLILFTVLRALRRDFVRHAHLARLTFPIWLYVSITGVVVYLMLYRMDLSVPSS